MCIASAFFLGGESLGKSLPTCGCPPRNDHIKNPSNGNFRENHGTSKVPAGRGYVIVSRRVTGPGLTFCNP